MANEVEINKGELEGAGMRKELEAHLASLLERKGADPELGGPPLYWDIVAIGPFQDPSVSPSRLIEVGEPATILTWVYLNPSVPSPYPGQNACDQITGFGASIELNFVTSNMQSMTPAAALTHQHCIKTTPGQCWYPYFYTFTPREAGCLYEMNICARICNCDNRYVRQYSAFARWVENLDYDLIFGAPAWQFDHSIRFMAADYNVLCGC